MILGANPGLSVGKTDLEETKPRRELFERARKHELDGNPFVFLRSEFEGTPGYEWWMKRTRKLRERLGSEEFGSLAFSAEIHPYKSVNYRALKNVLPTQAYTFELVDQLVCDGAWVIMLRAKAEWEVAVPAIRNSRRVIELNSRQSSYLTPGNMPAGAFERMVTDLATAPTK